MRKHGRTLRCAPTGQTTTFLPRRGGPLCPPDHTRRITSATRGVVPLCTGKSAIPYDYVEYEDLNEGGRLVWDVLGKEAALKLIRAVGGVRLYLQDASRLERRARLRMARELLARGEDPEEVRRKVKIPIRNARNIT